MTSTYEHHIEETFKTNDSEEYAKECERYNQSRLRD